ncbi:MAG: nucleotidyl transferase AbiEii/AbiGii toxin family protein [Anaerolineaceae bacterium]|nr:nucleotidyl transferase AbiEii/AbiGii toxin family protein [Anaerolineaceae bacterium]
MYYNILDQKRITILKSICEKILPSGFYLAGGTALSLQMNLRKSYDFDFFSGTSFNEDVLYNSVALLFPEKTRTINVNKGTCNLLVDGIQVSFFEYPYPLIKPVINCDLIQNLYLAGIEDIAAMKMSAIGGRGAKKDFFDLYHILTMTDMTSNGLLECIKQKYGENFDFTYMLMGMDYFDDAETEILPELFVEFDWNRTKDFFVRKKKELIDIAYYDISEKG